MSEQEAEIIGFPKSGKRNTSSTERIWGKSVYACGYVAVPSILIQAQRRLGLSPTQLNIIVQLLEYWREPSRKPFPAKKDIAKRIGVTEKTIQNNIRELEKAGFIRREIRKTAVGDYNTNIYHLDGLISKVQELEPEFTAQRRKRQEDKTSLETPAGLRQAP